MADIDVKDAFGPLQTAIFLRLNGDAPLTAQISGVFDDIPTNPVFPYVQIGIMSGESFQTHSRPGDDIIIFVEIFSQGEGMKEAQDIKNNIDRLLADRTDLVVTGFSSAGLWKIGSNSILEDFRGSKPTRHIALRYRALLQQD